MAFLLHREDCVRGETCNCKVMYNRTKKRLLRGGCCKIPVRLEIEKGNRHGLVFNVIKRNRVSTLFAGAYAPEPGRYPGKINYPESSTNTWAHEVGHCIGFPDQYLGGHNWNGSPGKFPIKAMSIMGSFQSRAGKDHLYYAQKWAADKLGEDFIVIKEVVAY